MGLVGNLSNAVLPPNGLALFLEVDRLSPTEKRLFDTLTNARKRTRFLVDPSPEKYIATWGGTNQDLISTAEKLLGGYSGRFANTFRRQLSGVVSSDKGLRGYRKR